MYEGVFVQVSLCTCTFTECVFCVTGLCVTKMIPVWSPMIKVWIYYCFQQFQLCWTRSCRKMKLWFCWNRIDFTLEFPRPLMPNMVLVGGINCNVRNPLPDVRHFLFCWTFVSLFLFTPTARSTAERWLDMVRNARMCLFRIWRSGSLDIMGL